MHSNVQYLESSTYFLCQGCSQIRNVFLREPRKKSGKARNTSKGHGCPPPPPPPHTHTHTRPPRKKKLNEALSTILLMTSH